MNIIFAPHPDDEIIGCYEVLDRSDCLVVYTTAVPSERLEEAKMLASIMPNHIIKFKIGMSQLEDVIVPLLQEDIEIESLYFPDPYWELHPEHRDLGSVGYRIWKNSTRGKGFDIIFYSTNMNSPYIHELSNADKVRKEYLLNTAYMSQKDLWMYEKKYVFLEGRVKYMR